MILRGELRVSLHTMNVGSLSIAVHFKGDFWPSSFDDGVAATREAFGNELRDPCSGGIVVSAPTGVDEGEGERDFWAIPLDSSSGRGQRRMLMSTIQCLNSSMGLPAFDMALDELRLVEFILHEGLTSIELRRVLPSD